MSARRVLTPPPPGPPRGDLKRAALRAVLCCAALLACAHGAAAQKAHAADPCGDPAAESSYWVVVRGRVVTVEGGDTLTVSFKGKGLRRVRLNGVEAPGRGRPYADAARRLLQSLAGGKTVDVWLKSSLMAARRLPAELTAVVRLPVVNYLDVGLLLVQSGLVRHKASAPYSMSNYTECHYVHAEKAARDSRRGLWRDAPRTAEREAK